MDCSRERGDRIRLLMVPSWLRRWMARTCMSAATYFFCVLMMLSLLLSPCAAKNVTLECGLFGGDDKCPAHHCCVKKVITFKNLNSPEVGTECQPLLTEGAMCLRDSEGYMCPCLPPMACDLASRFDTMGYCKPRRRPPSREG